MGSWLLSAILEKVIQPLETGTTYFLVCSHIGDAYALSSLASELKRAHGIAKLGIATVEKLRGVVEMFSGVDHFVSVKKSLTDLATTIRLGNHGKPRKIRVPGVNVAAPGLLEKITTFNGFTFWDMFLCELGLEPSQGRVAFRVPDATPHPTASLLELFEEEGSRLDDGVFICPSSRAMRMTESLRSFVRKLVGQVRKQGLNVYLNDLPNYLSDLRNEPELKVVHLKLTDLIPFADRVGRVVVVRSGLADLLTASKARMVVLYAPEKTQHLVGKRRYIEYFTLSPFEKNGEVLELEAINEEFHNALVFLTTSGRSRGSSRGG